MRGTRTYGTKAAARSTAISNEMIRILVVEDDEASRQLVARFLRRAKYEVIEARNGREAIAAGDDVDAVLLDVMMPEVDGWDVLAALRNRRPNLPILFVTALADPENELRGLRLGSDDYIRKPIDLDVLQARLEAVLERYGVSGRRSHGSLHIDLAAREVSVDGQPIDLTRTEFDLLAILSGQPGRVFTRDQLLDRVWGSDFSGVDRVVDVRISTLRRKLGDDGRQPRYIISVRGIGYRFQLDPDA